MISFGRKSSFFAPTQGTMIAEEDEDEAEDEEEEALVPLSRGSSISKSKANIFKLDLSVFFLCGSAFGRMLKG